MSENKIQDINSGIEDILKDVPEDFIKQRIDPNKVNPDETNIYIPEDQLDCIIMDLMYLQANNRDPEYNNSDLYPSGWFENPDYEKQFEILVEAVVENKKIIDTDGYNELRKGKFTR